MKLMFVKVRETGTRYERELLPNGDTLKQLLAKSRYLLYKKPYSWNGSQAIRAEMLFERLFERFSDIKQAYGLALQLSIDSILQSGRM